MVDLATALAELANAKTVQDVVNIASSLSAAATGPGGAVLYGGNVGSAAAEDIALTIAQADNLNIINETVRAQFLINPAVEAKLTAIYKALNPAASNAEIEELVTTELYGGTTSSLWGQASADFVKSIKGAVTVVALTVKQGRILGGVELPGILANSGITAINNIPVSGIQKTVSALTSTIESSVTSALSKGGIFAAASTETTTTAQFVSSQVLQALGLSANGAETTAQYASQGLAESSAPALETAAAVDAENLLAAAGSKALGLLGGPLGLAVVDLLFGSKPLNQGEDLLVAQQQAAWLALDTPAADQNQQVVNDTNGDTTINVPLVSTDGSVNDDFALSLNPTAKSVVLATATGNDSSLTVSSDLNGAQAVDDQITDVLPGDAYKDQIAINPGVTGTIDVTVTIEAGDTCEVSADASLSSVTQDFEFLGPTGTLKIDDPSTFAGVILGFVAGDTLDLAGIGTATGATLGAGNVLTVQESDGGALTLQLDSTQNFSGAGFTVSPDGNGGSDITVGGSSVVSLIPNAYYWIGGTGNFGTASSWDVAIQSQSGALTLSPAATSPGRNVFTVFDNTGTIIGSGSAGELLIGDSTTPDISVTVDGADLSFGTEVYANSGSLLVTGGGTISAVILDIGGLYRVAASVSIDSGVFSASDEIDDLDGTLSVNSGAVVSAGGIGIGGDNLGASVTVDGGNLSSSAALDIFGGVLSIEGDGKVSASSAIYIEGDFGAASATISGIGSTLTTGSLEVGYGGGTASLAIANGGSVSVTSGLTVGTQGTGSLDISSAMESAGSVTIGSTGTISLSAGTLDVTSAVDPSSSGSFLLMGASNLEIAACLGTNLKIQFIGSSNKLTIDQPTNFGLNVGTASYAGPLLEGFGPTDSIDLKGIVATAFNYSTTSGDLQLTGSGGSALTTLLFQNATLGAGSFHLASDGAGGTLLTHS
jgi:T5SS/PEP-CTERM-associated repeat protein